ncbi:hypothetical protein Nepgr_029598 [Nepenthes gracilis]|uniref:Uncharacterized protein n=1 Tax=Nepenthes gracilis TaxID=150966 RepID=A0AAD3TCT0_NEPGR|nr:hypothetical protein Nepgr_029598 [Nepenthes gracilis]
MLLIPTRTTLLVPWSTGTRAEFYRLTFNNWWSRCRPTIACSSYFVHRTSNDNKRLHQQPSLLLPPKGWPEEEVAVQEARKNWKQSGSSVIPRSWPEQAYGTLREYVSTRKPREKKSPILSGRRQPRSPGASLQDCLIHWR